MFMAVVMFKPEGLAGIGQDLTRRLRARRRRAPVGVPAAAPR
jgi:hypothetical protein